MQFARFLVLALLVALPAAACSDDDNPAAPDLGFEQISESELVAAGYLDDLSDEDRAAIRAILQAAHDELREIHRAVRAGTLTGEEARTQARQIHEDTIDALSAYLTEEQVARLLHRLHDGPPNGPPAGPRPGLALTDDQRAALALLQEEYRAFVTDLRARMQAGTVTAEEARDEVREQAQALRAAICDEVLTETQREQAPFCREGFPGGPPRGPRGG